MYDGTGAAPFRGSIAIRDGRIVATGESLDWSNGAAVDLDGLAIAPGIVDLHTHSDVAALSSPDCVSAIGQAITTQVVGHCGFSAAPTDEHTRRTLVAEEPVFGFPHPGGDAELWGWTDVASYLDAVDATRPATNIATLVGHNTIRRLVAGSSAGHLDAEAVGRMVRHVELALEQGAAGFSTGLSYAPGMFAPIEELAELAAAAGRAGRRYHTHMRYGDLTTRESLVEAIETARRSDTALNVSHLYPGRADPPDEAERLLELVDDANRDGIEVTFDLTLFRRGGGAWVQGLPGWARAGGLEETRRRIADRRDRALLVEAIRRRRDWDDQLVVKVNTPENAHLVGRTIGELARARGEEPAITALSLVVEDGQFWVSPTIKRQDDLDVLLSHPSCIPVTDGMAAHPVDHASLGLMPKTFGTFPLLFGDYVRRRRVLSLPEAVRRVTSASASRAGLTGRGVLTAGGAADLMVFDPDEIDNRATDQEPSTPPAGLRHVMVNGSWALFAGQLTGVRSGEALR